MCDNEFYDNLYVVSGEELQAVNTNGKKPLLYLKSNIKPVELVAEGEVKDNSFLPGIVSYTIGGIDDLKIFYKVYDLIGKSIKLYIEVI